MNDLEKEIVWTAKLIELLEVMPETLHLPCSFGVANDNYFNHWFIHANYGSNKPKFELKM